MSYYRSYFNKNNTIIKDSLVNTSKNPNTEIYYGDGFSKYIFQIDLSLLQNKIGNGDLVVKSDTKHMLHITNTIFGSELFVGQEKGSGGQRTSSFDLIIFKIDEYWDEGTGFNYEKSIDITNTEKSIEYRPSNWYNRTTLDPWSFNGIYPHTPNNIISTIHFDNGNEDINVDVTSYVNNILSGGTNYGLGVTFLPGYEYLNGGSRQSVAFFTKYTQTFFEPYIESTFNDIVIDNREDFINEIQRNLYLYVTKGGNYHDLDELPLVTILNSTSTVFDNGLENLTTEKIRKGIYKVSFGLSGTLCDGKRFYYDKWTNLKIDGINIPDTKQKFVPKQYTEMYNIGNNQIESNNHIIKFNGIQLNEKIKRGENRKINIQLKSINDTKTILSENIFYRIYIKEGKTQVNIFDWTKLDKTNENSFVLDTSFLIPREYYLEIKNTINTEELFYKNEIKFEIVSEK